MKKIYRWQFAGVLLVFFLVMLSLRGEGPYKDGTYEGRSRARYVQEPYVGTVTIGINGGRIKTIGFSIVDTLNNEIFDGAYEKHFTGNDLYIQQCRNDWKGVQDYPRKLLAAQDIERVDAVSGATWSFNIFKAATLKALEKAKK